MNSDEILKVDFFFQFEVFSPCHFQVILEFHIIQFFWSFDLYAKLFPTVWRTLKKLKIEKYQMLTMPGYG